MAALAVLLVLALVVGVHVVRLSREVTAKWEGRRWNLPSRVYSDVEPLYPGLNLARVLVDGEQIVVGLPAAATAPPTAPVGGSTPGAPLVDLNTATTVELEGLPEVGPVTAEAIVAWRDQHGGFTAVAELLEVDGIGDATLATIAPFVTV